jgi:hypothetical protein
MIRVLDVKVVLEERAQRRFELAAEAAERGERLEVGGAEDLAERLVGEDRRADSQLGE